MKKLLVAGLCLAIFFTISASPKKDDKKEKNGQTAETVDPKVEELQSLIALKDDTIASQKKTIDSLLIFKAMYIASAHESYIEYSTRPFSRMDMDTLDMMLEEINSMAKYDSRLEELSKTLDKTKANSHEYDRLYSAIMKNPFSINEKSGFFVDLERLGGKVSQISNEQKKEVDDLSYSLGLAVKGIENMNKTINAYEQQLESLRPQGKELSKEDLKYNKKQAEQGIAYVRENLAGRLADREKLYFSKIPWQKEKYERLNYLLDNDPLGPEFEEIRDLFISLAPEE